LINFQKNEINVSEMLKTDYKGDALFTVSNFLSPDQCLNVIKRCTEKGWKKSAPSGGGRTGHEDARTNQFSIFNDSEFSQKLWDNVKQFVPSDLEFLGENVYFSSKDKGKEWKAVGVNDHLRCYKYDPGEAFPEHIDYKMKRVVWRMNPDTKKPTAYIQQTFLAFLIYLNDDFTGGETGYWPSHEGIHCRFLRESENKPHQVNITPVTGTAVIQDENILHEGLPTRKGVKYILRTDIVHERPAPIALYDKIPKKMPSVGEWERLFETSCKNYAD
jgi:prolyl 4-hydroxylase